MDLSNVTSGVTDLVSKIVKLPGNLLSDLVNILPSDKSHEDFDKYCEAKGGTVSTDTKGRKICTMAMAIGEDHHKDMLNALAPSESKPDYSDMAGGIASDSQSIGQL